MHAFIVCLLARRVFLFVIILLAYLQVHGQVKWDGGGGDGLWNTPANWIGDFIPVATDEVVLDHSFISGNYIVTLPSGMTTVTVRTLVISPSPTGTIELRLPLLNTAVPAFTATGSVYGLEIHEGGIFRNSSGASAGTPIDISDSIKIHNGGLFIHNTARAHANNVTVLSKAPGTEQGSFEFDVPGGAGYTVSIAGRVYGNLILSAAAAGGAKSYTSTGVTAVSINGQFRIKPGANYSLNFNGGFIVHGDFVHDGNVFDISGGLHSNRINLRKNVSVAGIITETGTGFPVIEFDGTIAQGFSVTGAITDSVGVRLNNAAGVTLQTPLSILYKLELVRGNIKTTSTNILTVHDNATCGGSSADSFVEGPMRKRGDDNFQFPIGKQGSYAAVSISGTGGSIDDEFEAEYFLGSPGMTFGSAIENPPLVRISALEYWKVDCLVGTAPKKISLSVGTFSDATLLEKLVVTRWDVPGNLWKDAGNTAYSGIATGTLTSNDLSTFGVFTIASTIQNQNPLPMTAISFYAISSGERALLKWQIDQSLDIKRFEIWRSEDKVHFRPIKHIPALSGKCEYEFSETLFTTGTYQYKIIMIEENGGVHQSSVGSVTFSQPGIHIQVASGASGPTLHLTLQAPGRTVINIVVFNAEGKALRKLTTQPNGRLQNLAIDVSGMPAGTYYIIAASNQVKAKVVRFVKLE